MSVLQRGRVRGALAAVAGLAAVCLAPACRPPSRAEPREAVRLVSLHDVTTEAAVRLGAAAALVGVGELVSPTPDVRAAVAGVPRVASLESIVAVAPTAVLGLSVVAEQDPELVAALRRRGIDVYLGAPRTLDGVYQVVREVARRARRETAGEGLIAAARARAAGPSRGPDRPSPVTLFVYDCCDPPFTTGGATVLSDLITRAGGQNVFADLSAGWTHVSWEQVVARRPRLIVIDDYASSGVGLDKKRARLASIPSLAAVPVVTLPLGLALGGLGSVEALDRLRAFVSAVAGVER